MNPIKYLFTFLVALAGFGFVYGILKACFISWPSPNTSAMPLFMSNLVISISAILATNFGAVVGNVASSKTSLYRKSDSWNPFKLFSGKTPTVLQTIACYLYLIGL